MTPPKSKSEMKRLAVQQGPRPAVPQELQFKAEDFQGTDLYLQDNMFLDAFVEIANRLLAERLGAAPVHEWNELKNPDGWVYYRARLVCIEKLEGK